MKFFVKFTVYDSINTKEHIRTLRAGVGKKIEEFTNSDKFVDGAIFGGERGGYVIFEVERFADVYDLLGGDIIDQFKLEVHPLISFEELGEFFAKDDWS